LGAGAITPFDIYTIDPFGNGFEAYQLSVGQLEDLLEQINTSYSYSSAYTLVREGDQIEITANGVELPDDQLLTFALNDYITHEFGDLFDTPDVSYEKTTAEYIIEYLKTMNPGPIDYQGCER
jgi:5'-nucleotidase